MVQEYQSEVGAVLDAAVSNEGWQYAGLLSTDVCHMSK